MEPQRSGTFISVEDYLDGEQDSQVRHEYVDGEVYAMVGASDRHGLLETLEEYVLVSQDFRLVEVFRRSDGWQAIL